MIFLFHPDYTVGGRISLPHEGLALSQTITAGMELHHASKKSDSIVIILSGCLKIEAATLYWVVYLKIR